MDDEKEKSSQPGHNEPVKIKINAENDETALDNDSMGDDEDDTGYKLDAPDGAQALIEEALKRQEEREVKKKLPRRSVEEIEQSMNEMRKDFHMKLMEAEEKLKTKEEEIVALNDRLLRAVADLDNYKKRVQRDKAEQFNYGNEVIAKELLPVVDNLERALEHVGERGENDPFVAGVELTLRSFQQMLSKFHIEPIDALGEKFDPTYHQAIAQIDVPDDKAGFVVEEHFKGYLLKDRLLRPSMVVVGKKAEPKKEVVAERDPENGEDDMDHGVDDN